MDNWVDHFQTAGAVLGTLAAALIILTRLHRLYDAAKRALQRLKECVKEGWRVVRTYCYRRKYAPSCILTVCSDLYVCCVNRSYALRVEVIVQGRSRFPGGYTNISFSEARLRVYKTGSNGGKPYHELTPEPDVPVAQLRPIEPYEKKCVFALTLGAGFEPRLNEAAKVSLENPIRYTIGKVTHSPKPFIRNLSVVYTNPASPHWKGSPDD